MARTFVLTVTGTYFSCDCGEVRMGFTPEAVESAAKTHAGDHLAAGDRPALCGTCCESGDSPFWTAKCGA